MGNKCTANCLAKNEKPRSRTQDMRVNRVSAEVEVENEKFDEKFCSQKSGDTCRDTVNEFSLVHGMRVKTLVENGDCENIKKFLDGGFLVDFPLDRSGWTLTHAACQLGSKELLELLVSYKAYVNAQEIAEGWTPLMVCAVNNYKGLAMILINAGADRSIKDNSGKTAKDLAEKYRSKKVIEIL